MNLLESFFLFVLDASWRGACLIALLLTLRPLWRGRIPVRALFAAWILVAARLLVPVAVPVAWSPFNLVRLASPRGGSRQAFVPNAAPAVAAPLQSSVRATNAFLSPAPTPTEEHSKNPIAWLPIAALLWVAVAALLALFRLGARWRFARRVRRFAVATPAALLGAVADVRRQFEAEPVKVVVTPAVTVPALFGLRRPVLLFPPGLAEKLSAAELRLIVAHEIGHCQRRDLMAAALIRTAAILHWFNPLVWIGARLAKDDCEMACDEFVLRRANPDAPAAYGNVLLKTLGLVPAPHRMAVALGMIESKQQLKARIHHIAGYRSATFLGALGAVGLFALLATVGLTREVSAETPAAASGSTVTSRGGALEEDFAETHPLKADGSFEVSNANGAVSIGTWDRPEVRIVGKKRAATDQDLKDIELEIHATPDHLSIDTHYPHHGWTGWMEERRESVELTITIPKGASIENARIVNGSLTIDGPQGTVNASSVNGSIHAVGLAQDASFKSVNGSLYAEFPGLPAKGRLRFNTVNGSITVRLPKTIGTSVQARTVNGRVRCDLPMQVTSSRRSNLDGQIGDGSGSFTAHSVNGSIEIQGL